MKVAVLAVHYPFGNAEAYLGVELSALVHACEEVIVVPMWRGRGVRELPAGVLLFDLPTFSVRCLLAALSTILTRPRQTAVALFTLANSRSRLSTKVKNLAILPKALALAAWARNRGIEHIHAYWLSTPATAAFIAASIAEIPWSASAHRWDIYEENALDIKGRHARFIRTISERGERDLCERLPMSLRMRVRHVPIGVVVPEIVTLPRNSTNLRLICPAALVEVKGHETLLRALAILRERGCEVRCDFAGIGPLSGILKRHCNELGLHEVVRFLGFVPQEELHAALSRGEYSAVVLSSNHGDGGLMEGIPTALIEAMSRGVPVIATDSGSTGELVDATTGALVPVSNPLALANAISAVGEDLAQVRSRALRAYERVRDRHDHTRQMRVLAALMNDTTLVLERSHS